MQGHEIQEEAPAEESTTGPETLRLFRFFLYRGNIERLFVGDDLMRRVIEAVY